MTTLHLSREDLQRFFEVFDEDGSGFISADELSEAFASMGWEGINPTHCEHMIKEQFGAANNVITTNNDNADGNGEDPNDIGENHANGNARRASNTPPPPTLGISFEQFVELIDTVRMPTDSEAECRRAFKYFDNSGIGKITVADLKQAGRIATGREVPDSLIRQIMDAVDLNKDHFIQYSEFSKAVSRVGVKELSDETFEKEAGNGVGFGGGRKSKEVLEQEELMRLLMSEEDTENEEFMRSNGSGVDLADTDIRNMPSLEDTCVGGGASSLNASARRVGGASSARMLATGLSGTFGSTAMSMSLNGRMLRQSNYRSQYWDVKPHVTPSQRAEMQYLRDSEWRTRSILEGDEEEAFGENILIPWHEYLESEEERKANEIKIAAEREAQREAQIKREAEEKEAERLAAKARARQAKLDAEKAKSDALAAFKEKRAAQKAAVLSGNTSALTGSNMSLSDTNRSSLLHTTTGAGPKPTASRPPTATPRSNSKPAGSHAGNTLKSTSMARSSAAASPSPDRGSGSMASSRTESMVATPSGMKGSSSSTTRRPTAAGATSTAAPFNSPTPMSRRHSDSHSNAGSSVTGGAIKPSSSTTSTSAANNKAAAPASSASKKQTLVICKVPVTFTNNRLSKAETREMLKQFGYADDALAEDDFDYLWSEGDRDGDGFVTAEEYRYVLGLLGEYET